MVMKREFRYKIKQLLVIDFVKLVRLICLANNDLLTPQTISSIDKASTTNGDDSNECI